MEAFNNQDAKAIAALWSPDAVYMNPKTGETVTGRKEIEQQLVGIFAESKDTKLEVTVDSVRFVITQCCRGRRNGQCAAPGSRTGRHCLFGGVYQVRRELAPGSNERGRSGNRSFQL